MRSWTEIIEGLRVQDSVVQMEVVEVYKERLYACLLGLFTADNVHQQDCLETGIMDAFRELFARPDSFDPAKANSHDPLFAFLVSKARRRAIDCLRTVKSEHLTPGWMERFDDLVEIARAGEPIDSNTQRLNDMVEDYLTQRIDATEFVAYVMLRIDSETLLSRLESMSAECRTVLILKDVVGLPVIYIAQVLNRKEDAVEAILRRARNILRGVKRSD